MEVEKPLKHRMRIKKPNSDLIWVEFRYERLTFFCFICGCLGHKNRKCGKIYDFPNGNIPKPFGCWMKASTRRTQFYGSERWFRTSPSTDHAIEGSCAEVETMKIDKPTVWNVGNYGVRSGVNGNDMEVTTKSVMLSIKGKALTRSIGPS